MSEIAKRLTPAEIAAILDCSTSQVLTLIKSGKIRGINIGTGLRPRYRIDPAELDRFEKGHETKKPTLRRPKEIKVKNHLRF